MDRTRQGDTAAFEQLYRRHADAAWRAAQTILPQPDDAGDAVAEAFTSILRTVKNGDGGRIMHFRAYLLTATRHAAIDRRRAREILYDDAAVFAEDESLATAENPHQHLVDLTDTAFVSRAFYDLPERWRRVLWLTEVEGLRPVDAAPHLEMNANAVTQLAFRARAGLRERYLTAHLNNAEHEDCAYTVERLAALTLNRLTGAEAHQVELHLDECESCTRRREELESVGAHTRRLRVVLPFLLVGRALRRAAASLSGTTEVAGTGPGLTHATSGLVTAAVTAVVAAGGITGLAFRMTAPPGAQVAGHPVEVDGATPGEIESIALTSTSTSTSTSTTTTTFAALLRGAAALGRHPDDVIIGPQLATTLSEGADAAQADGGHEPVEPDGGTSQYGHDDGPGHGYGRGHAYGPGNDNGASDEHGPGNDSGASDEHGPGNDNGPDGGPPIGGENVPPPCHQELAPGRSQPPPCQGTSGGAHPR